MGRVFTPARMPPGTVPEILARSIKAADAFLKGAVLIEEAGATGKVQEASADPTPIIGVALEPSFSKPGYELSHSSQVLQVTGRSDEVSMARANRLTVFSGRMINGATDPVTPAITDIGVLYGIAAVSGEWVVDQADTVNTRVEVIDIDIEQKIVYFKFMEAHIAAP